MEFVTNRLEWAAVSIVALYKSHWRIDVFLQGDQADAATLRLPRAQQERRAVAALDGAAAVRAVALSSVCASMAARVQALLLPAALECLGRLPRSELGQGLWDSRRHPVDAGGGGTALFSRFKAVMGRRADEQRLSYVSAGGPMAGVPGEMKKKCADTDQKTVQKKLENAGLFRQQKLITESYVRSVN
jgi:hypothetical protein